MVWVTKIANLVSDNIKETSNATQDVESLQTDLTNDQNEMNKVTLSAKWERAMIESSKLVKFRNIDLKKNYEITKFCLEGLTSLRRRSSVSPLLSN